MKIHAAVEADLPLLAQMNQRLIEDEGSRNLMSLEELQERMQGWLNGEWSVRLCSESDAFVGYAVFQLRQDEYFPERRMVYLRQFFIERGRRSQGLGSQFFMLLAQSEFPPGCQVVVDALATNPGGFRFWSKMGFEPYLTTMHFGAGG